MRDPYVFEPFRLNPETMELFCKNEKVEIRRQAVQMLCVLVSHSWQMIPYMQLARTIWNEDQSTVESLKARVKTTINEVRNKLGDDGPKWIRTYEIVGAYRFEHPDLKPDADWPAACITIILDNRAGEMNQATVEGIRYALVRQLSELPHFEVHGPPDLEDSTSPVNAAPLESVTSDSHQSQYVLRGFAAIEQEEMKIHLELLLENRIVWSSDGLDLREVQDIAERIADSVNVQITREEIKKMGSRKKVDKKTFALYTLGLHHWNRPTLPDLTRAIDYFTKATSRDDSYAPAFAGLAHAHALLALGGFREPREVMSKAQTAAERCLSIDSKSAEGLTALAAVRAYYEWRWQEAEELLQLAIKLNPRYETAHHLYAMGCLMPLGRIDEALREITQAARLSMNLGSPFVVTCLGIVLYYAREYELALEQLDHALELQPHFHLAHWHRGWTLVAMKRLNEALEAAEAASTESRGALQVRAALGMVYAESNRPLEARVILEELTREGKSRYVSSFDLALIHAALNEESKTLRLLQRAVKERAPMLARLNVHPVLDFLRSNYKFKELLGLMNIRPTVGAKASHK